MNVEELLVFAKQYIHKDHAKILLAELLQKNPLELLANLDLQVSKEQEEIFKNEIQAIMNGKPLQYVIGHVNFYGNSFDIDNRVLIPRYETEELVEQTIEYINKYFTNPVDIIDLGCGSGVIGLTLEQKVSTKTVDLIDISPKALEIAEKNKRKMNSNATIIQSDFLSKIEKKYDVIISNPPYIKTNEEIETIVKENEPHIALYAGEDGLDCYRKILSTIEPHMKEKCLIAFEIGSTQAEDIKKIVLEYLYGVNIIVKKDLSNRDRMLFILKNIE